MKITVICKDHTGSIVLNEQFDDKDKALYFVKQCEGRAEWVSYGKSRMRKIGTCEIVETFE